MFLNWVPTSLNLSFSLQRWFLGVYGRSGNILDVTGRLKEALHAHTGQRHANQKITLRWRQLWSRTKERDEALEHSEGNGM
ncbi:hypothetical protein Leryth_019496 [Lithospermum erythrorhizon]|nr:hypothetical protein Leryth_019496 [Lithospermum erythrorhizon]